MRPLTVYEGIMTGLIFASLLHVVSDTMSLGVILHCPVHHILFWYSAFFFLTVTIFALLSVKFSEPWAEELGYRCCIYRWAHSSFLFCAYLLVVGLCTTTFYIKRSIWWGFRYPLIYGHEDKNLVDSVLLYAFSRIIALNFHLKTITYHPWVFKPINIRYRFYLI